MCGIELDLLYFVWILFYIWVGKRGEGLPSLTNKFAVGNNMGYL